MKITKTQYKSALKVWDLYQTYCSWNVNSMPFAKWCEEQLEKK